jgi:DNA-binding transcriptional ArsR family regulator
MRVNAYVYMRGLGTDARETGSAADGPRLTEETATHRYIGVSMDAQTFQVLGDPTRLRILDALRAGELCVNDLVARMDIHQSGVSRHLRILHGAGFVEVRPSGQQRLYSLREAPFREIDAWVAAYRGLWEKRLDALGQALERRKAERRAAAVRRRPS